ncbi:MAG TPA: hypothetical protein PLR65_10820, partial [Anaerolineales bacterium]|nr:hypothetical protein [Anaerolineales bacterium]
TSHRQSLFKSLDKNYFNADVSIHDHPQLEHDNETAGVDGRWIAMTAKQFIDKLQTLRFDKLNASRSKGTADSLIHLAFDSPDKANHRSDL